MVATEKGPAALAVGPTATELHARVVREYIYQLAREQKLQISPGLAQRLEAQP